MYFNPRSPHGERRNSHQNPPSISYFNPRSPHGERRTKASRPKPPKGNFNPRSPHGERRRHKMAWNLIRRFQSTLPARGATSGVTPSCNAREISIHAPRTGSDRDRDWLANFARQFQSTLPARGATCHRVALCVMYTAFQSTLPARGATLTSARNPTAWAISIHAPRTGSDLTISLLFCAYTTISIHAPRTGSDFIRLDSVASTDEFQSTLPARGATIQSDARLFQHLIFQSTLPARGATAEYLSTIAHRSISIHAPRTGSDAQQFLGKYITDEISIHAPRTGSDDQHQRY